MKGKDWVWGISIFSVSITAVPIIFILYYGFVVFHSTVGLSRTVFESIGVTIVSSALAALIIFLVFTPLAFELSRKSHAVWEAVSDLPASIPHPIVGIAFLIVGSPLTPFGRFLTAIGFGLFNTLQGLVLALSFVAMPIYLRSAQSIFASAPLEPENFAMTLGASRMRVLYSVLVPGASREIISSSLTAMSRAMSEFGSIAIIANYVLTYPFNGAQAVSVEIYQSYGYLGPGVAVTSSALMILFSLALVIAIRFVGGGHLSSRIRKENNSGRWP